MFKLNLNKNTILIGIAIVAIIVTGVLIFTDSSTGFSLSNLIPSSGQSADQLGQKAVDYINNNGLSSTPATLVSSSEESGLIKAKIQIGTNEFDSYITKDGKLLFPQAFDMSGEDTIADNSGSDGNTNTDATPADTTIAKSDSPVLDAYVVSRCPFGLQMQRAMAEAVKEAPALADYLKVRYIGSVSGNTITAMHGNDEAQENLRQICIREEQSEKYWDYTTCQMKSGDTTGCEKSTGVNSTELSSCISDTSRGVAYAKEDFDLNIKYNVIGSPTLVVGDALVYESNYGGRSADAVKKIVCAGFNTEPSFCSQTLNTAVAASSFSETYSSGSGGAANNAANCN